MLSWFRSESKLKPKFFALPNSDGTYRIVESVQLRTPYGMRSYKLSVSVRDMMVPESEVAQRLENLNRPIIDG